MANTNENKPLYEVMHLAKTRRIKGFRLQGYDYVFWYNHEKKIFCVKSNIESKTVEDIQNLFRYIGFTYHSGGWYSYDGPFGTQESQTVSQPRYTYTAASTSYLYASQTTTA